MSFTQNFARSWALICSLFHSYFQNSSLFTILHTPIVHPPTVCELDLVFSLHKSLMILFEMFIGGMLCESNRREVLQQIVEAEELVEQMTKPGEDTSSQLDDGLSFQEQFQLGRKPGARGPRGNR